MNEANDSQPQSAESTESTTTPAPKPAPARALLKRLRFLPLAIIFATIAILVWLDLESKPTNVVQFINEIAVTRPASLSIDAGSLIGSNGEQDFYVVIKTNGGNETELPTIPNTLIGNGLTWQLPTPLALTTIAEIELRDDDLGADDKLDRVTVNNQLINTGQKYQFELIEQNPTEPPPDLRIIWSIISGCGVLALVTALLFIRDQATD